MESSRACQGRAQATRGLTAMALLSLMVVASADRALLASRPGGPGALHAVAIGVSNYYVTNGNGSWVPTKYSTDATPNSAYATAAGYGSSATNIVARFSDGITSVAFPSKNLGVAVGVGAGTISATVTTSTIMITIDQGLSWMAVTGLPTFVNPAVAFSSATTPVTQAFPAVASVPDLNAVYFASKTLGWAVGGLLAPVGATPAPTVAEVLMTTNGATVWQRINVAPPKNTLNVNPLPGTLLAVQSDAAGKNVFAVGAAPTLYLAAANPPANAWGASTQASNNYVATPLSYGTILYSANSGASWVYQTAPAISTWVYALTSVAVTKGSTAWAVGGSGEFPQGDSTTPASSYGMILSTTNGGFSWTQAVYQGSGDGTAPAFTAVAANGGTVWVVGFISNIAYWPIKSVTVNSVVQAGTSFTVLTSTDGKNFFPATSNFPAGFKVTGTTNPSTLSNSVYGITWDNTMHGFMYGDSFILSTQDGGKNWVYETPNNLITQTSPAGQITCIANVPTTY